MSIGHGRGNRGFAGLLGLAAAAFAAALLVPRGAAAFSEQVLNSFCQAAACTDGSVPAGGLVRDDAGRLYGTTSSGGGANAGVVFELDPDGTYLILQDLGGGNGVNPSSGLLLDSAGNLYGTTFGGGANGGGVVFELTPDPDHVTWTYTVLYSFCAQPNCTDGTHASGGVIMDGSGNLYGTTRQGGDTNWGTVFQLAPQPDGTWTETVLYSFCALDSCADGAHPETGVAIDSAGNLYGTVRDGGWIGSFGLGGVFQVPSGGGENLIFGFDPQFPRSNGATPAAGVIVDVNGNLFGTTLAGGMFDHGVVFGVTPDGTTETTFYRFCQESNCADGSEPTAALIIDQFDNVFGTTAFGGTGGGAGLPCGLGQCGTIFSLAFPDRTETVLYSFCQQANCSDGREPRAGLIEDGAGNLYGTTASGGDAGRGVVFRLSP